VNLTEEEINLVIKHRENVALNDTRASLFFVISDVATQWIGYSKELGVGLSYSEFCDGFNVDTRIDKKYINHRKFIFSGVEKVCGVVGELVSHVEKPI